METEVKCVANTCMYWVLANRCGAKMINVRTDGKDQAGRPEETMCGRYRRRRGMRNMLSSMRDMNWQEIAVEPLLRGQQLSPEVGCEVSNCRYWDDRRCTAQGIEIVGRRAEDSPGTNCATFEE